VNLVNEAAAFPITQCQVSIRINDTDSWTINSSLRLRIDGVQLLGQSNYYDEALLILNALQSVQLGGAMRVTISQASVEVSRGISSQKECRINHSRVMDP